MINQNLKQNETSLQIKEEIDINLNQMPTIVEEKEEERSLPIYKTFDDFYNVIKDHNNINTVKFPWEKDISKLKEITPEIAQKQNYIHYKYVYNFMRQLLKRTKLTKEIRLNKPGRVQAGTYARNENIEIEKMENIFYDKKNNMSYDRTTYIIDNNFNVTKKVEKRVKKNQNNNE